jgi:hypothetical protein
LETVGPGAACRLAARPRKPFRGAHTAGTASANLVLPPDAIAELDSGGQ